MDERRNQPRTEVDWPIEVYLDNRTIEGEVKNITINGIFVCCEEPLALDEEYHFSIFPPNYEAINVVGKALWSDSYASHEKDVPVCIGIVFVKMSTMDLESLKDILQSSIAMS